MPLQHTNLLRQSLVLVWLGTALVSVIEHQGQGRDLLLRAGLQSEAWIQTLVWGGALADACVGLALWRWPGKASYTAALCLMLGMTAVATVLLPQLWLDPLGSLLKNLPIAAMLWVLMKEDRT